MVSQEKETSKKVDSLKTRKRGLGSIGRKIATGVIAGALAFEGGGIIYSELTNDLPISAQTLQVDALHPWNIGLIWNIGLTKKDIPLTFNNNAETNIVEARVNAVPATEEDLSSVGNVISSSSTQQGYFQTELIFPALLKTGDKVKIENSPHVIYPDYTEAVNLKSRYDFTIERKGTQLASGILDKNAQIIEVFKDPVYVVDNVSYFNGITIRVTRNDGSKYEISIQDPQDVRGLKPLPILNDAPQLVWEDVQVGNHTETEVINIDQPGKIINADTPLLETVATNAFIEYGLSNHGFTTSSKILVFDAISFLTNSNNQLEYFPQP